MPRVTRETRTEPERDAGTLTLDRSMHGLSSSYSLLICREWRPSSLVSSMREGRHSLIKVETRAQMPRLTQSFVALRRQGLLYSVSIDRGGD